MHAVSVSISKWSCSQTPDASANRGVYLHVAVSPAAPNRDRPPAGLHAWLMTLLRRHADACPAYHVIMTQLAEGDLFQKSGDNRTYIRMHTRSTISKSRAPIWRVLHCRHGGA